MVNPGCSVCTINNDCGYVRAVFPAAMGYRASNSYKVFFLSPLWPRTRIFYHAPNLLPP